MHRILDLVRDVATHGLSVSGTVLRVGPIRVNLHLTVSRDTSSPT